MSLRPPGSSEKVSFDLDLNKVMDGTERYPIIGDLVSQELADSICSSFSGALLYASCMEKNSVAKLLVPVPTQLFLGEFLVYSSNMQSSFRYAFNPPIEFHAWLLTESKEIIDFALPGAILRGMELRDSIGPFVQGREPSILAGKCPDWIKYEAKQKVSLNYYDGGQVISEDEAREGARKRISEQEPGNFWEL